MSDDLPAGDFAAWLVEIGAAMRGEAPADVPCDGCTACCTSWHLVHIEPDEKEALARIPRQFLFPAPVLPDGHMLLGYDQRGHCLMLVDNRCSIYEHRPRTCRSYDCRIFPATGLGLDGEDEEEVMVTLQARRWRFTYATEADRDRQQAVRAAAAYLDSHRDLLPQGAVPLTATQLAPLAIQIHDVFLGGAEPDAATVQAAVWEVIGRR